MNKLKNFSVLSFFVFFSIAICGPNALAQLEVDKNVVKELKKIESSESKKSQPGAVISDEDYSYIIYQQKLYKKDKKRAVYTQFDWSYQIGTYGKDNVFHSSDKVVSIQFFQGKLVCQVKNKNYLMVWNAQKEIWHKLKSGTDLIDQFVASGPLLGVLSQKGAVSIVEAKPKRDRKSGHDTIGFEFHGGSPTMPSTTYITIDGQRVARAKNLGVSASSLDLIENRELKFIQVTMKNGGKVSLKKLVEGLKISAEDYTREFAKYHVDVLHINYTLKFANGKTAPLYYLNFKKSANSNVVSAYFEVDGKINWDSPRFHIPMATYLKYVDEDTGKVVLTKNNLKQFMDDAVIPRTKGFKASWKLIDRK